MTSVVYSTNSTLLAFFFSPDDLNPGAEPLESIDLEHFFKMIHLFFLFPTKRSLRDCRDIFTKPKQVFAEPLEQEEEEVDDPLQDDKVSW